MTTQAPPVAVRDWFAWAAVWTLVVQAPMWVAVGADAVQERSDPTMGATPVAGWMPLVGVVLAVAVPATLLLSVLGKGVLRPRPIGLFLGGLALGTATVAWTGFADNDTGPWYVGLTAAAAVVAFAAAFLAVHAPDLGSARWPTPTVGAVLVLAGAMTTFSSWRGGSYWDWRGSSARAYEAGLGVGVGQVLMGLSVRWWIRAVGTVRGPLAVVAAALGAYAVLVGVAELLDLRVLHRWEEDENPWSHATPMLLAGVGLLASAEAARRCRGDLLGLSFSAATTGGLLALWRESTWGSVMW